MTVASFHNMHYATERSRFMSRQEGAPHLKLIHIEILSLIVNIPPPSNEITWP